MTEFLSASDPSLNAGPKTTDFNPAGGAAPVVDPPADQPVVFEYKGRKFTSADLAKKLDHADTHIATLTTETAEQRRLLDEANELLQKQINTVDLLKQIKEPKVTESVTPPTTPPATPTVAEIAAEVRKGLTEEAQAAQRNKNFEEAKTELVKVFGDKTNAKVAEVAAANDMTVEEAIEMARVRPKVFLKLFPGMESKGKPSVLATGQLNTQAMTPASGGERKFVKASTTKESISVLKARYKELGLD